MSARLLLILLLTGFSTGYSTAHAEECVLWVTVPTGDTLRGIPPSQLEKCQRSPKEVFLKISFQGLVRTQPLTAASLESIVTRLESGQSDLQKLEKSKRHPLDACSHLAEVNFYLPSTQSKKQTFRVCREDVNRRKALYRVVVMIRDLWDAAPKSH